ncbi:zinc finger protein 862-like [Dendrobates tinctorius]|uniref:zinc finger protein 862-like n=1 Tax=Dendrobates tinctorius TaxID=92724 RepID=UPI003CC9527F
MIGRHSGVGKRLQAMFPVMLHFHCIAHRLALAISQASEGIPQMINDQHLIGTLYSYFNSSMIRQESLRKMQEVLEHDQISLKEIHTVRWLSLGRTVDALHESFDAVILVLTDFVATKKRSVGERAPGLLKACSEYGFIAILCLLRDVLELINRGCRVFQSEDINFSILLNELTSVTALLEKMKATPGKHLTAFLSEMSASECYYRDIKINVRSTSQTEFQTVKEKFLNNLLYNLSERFSFTDLSILTDLDQILNPMCLPQVLSKDESFENIVHKFCVPESEASTYQCKLPNESGLWKEWLEVSDLLKMYRGRLKMVDFCQFIISYKIDDMAVYPEFSALASIALTLPLSTASCERGFSTQNRIKSKKRSRLTDIHLEDLSRISEEGPSFSLTNETVQCSFDFQAAVALWKQKNQRLNS